MNEDELTPQPGETTVLVATETKDPETEDIPINAGGWLFLILAWICIIGLVVFCFNQLFMTQEKLTAPLEIDTED